MSSFDTSSSLSMRWRPNFTLICLHVRKHDDYDFFQWVDTPSPSIFCRNNCARRLKIEKDTYEAKLQHRIMSESVALAQLKLKNEECEALKVKLDEAEAWKNWCCGLMKWIPVFMWVVAFVVGKLWG